MSVTAAEQRAWAQRAFDPWDPRITHENIWAMYQAMREAPGLVRSDAHGGFFCVSRYVDVRRAAIDFRTFISGEGVLIGRTRTLPAIPLELDRPEHARFRKPMQAPFMPKRIGSFEQIVRRRVEALLDRIVEKPTFDIVEDLAEPLPLQVISEFLGISDERHEAHRRVAADLVHSGIGTAANADDAYYEFMMEEVQARKRAPGEDFISELLVVEDDDGRFSDWEVVRMARAIALAGHHTTINGTSSMLQRVSAWGQLPQRRGDAELLPRIVDEALRIDAPVHYEARTAAEDSELAGETIPAGSTIVLFFASGNRDEEAFKEPSVFDPEADRVQHLAFGHGIHKCLGEHLSRLEMRIVLEEVAQRMPAFELLDGSEHPGMTYGHHMGWSKLPAKVSPG